MSGEVYQGVKFSVVFRQKEPPHHALLDDLRAWCYVFAEQGLAPPYTGGTYGNMSMRIPGKKNRFIITGTGTGMNGTLTDDAFVLVEDYCPKTGRIWVRGTREPSSESFMHAMIYGRRPEVLAVFHGHCPEIIGRAGKLGIPVTEREEPYGTPALMRSVEDIMEEHLFFVMKNHGFVSLGISACEAGNRAMEMLAKAQRLK